jgi:tRNA threonylcarbamoyladenosine biosynthesis protein TsaE
MNADRVGAVRGDLPALDEAALAACAARLAAALHEGGVIHLVGELGAGKTTFARALLRALGAEGRIKSPTYSLVESYRVGGFEAHHLDLYRIASAGELEWLGLDELAAPGTLLLIEWPERGAGVVPAADLSLEFAHAGVRRNLEARALTARGRRWLAGDSGLPEGSVPGES